MLKVIFESWCTIAALIIIMFSVVAIKASIKFDLNKYLKERRRIKIEKQKNLCPHADWYVNENGENLIRSLYGYHIINRYWICSRCERVEYDKLSIDSELKYWGKNPKELNKRIKKIVKLDKQLGGT